MAKMIKISDENTYFEININLFEFQKLNKLAKSKSCANLFKSQNVDIDIKTMKFLTFKIKAVFTQLKKFLSKFKSSNILNQKIIFKLKLIYLAILYLFYKQSF